MNDYLYFTVTLAGYSHGLLRYKLGKVYKVNRCFIGTCFYVEGRDYLCEISPVEAIAAGAVIDVLAENSRLLKKSAVTTRSKK